jgi:hypothetical protein
VAARPTTPVAPNTTTFIVQSPAETRVRRRVSVTAPR